MENLIFNLLRFYKLNKLLSQRCVSNIYTVNLSTVINFSVINVPYILVYKYTKIQNMKIYFNIVFFG